MTNTGHAKSPWLLHEAVANQAASRPGRTAIVSAKHILTYRTLLENACSIARQLRGAGVRREVAVASCLPRGLALGPAVLGTWLAGGACVPLDPDGPSERRQYMLHDSNAAAIIATADTAPAVRESTTPIVIVDAFGATAMRAAEITDAQLPRVSPRDLAYIIYTSGSTGRPKGVLVEHANLAAMARSHEAALYGGQGREVRHIALNNVTLADSFFSDFAHLAYGRTLHVVGDATRRDPERLAQFITDYRVEVLDATPTQIQTLVLAGQADCLASLTVLILGGEPTSPGLWQLLSELTGVQPYNLYGPTECTVAVTATPFRDHLTPMLGSPLPGCAVWVVDDQLRQVPPGETGELLVTGAQVARGYLNPTTADAARFVRFQPPGGSQTVRAYRTGDRGRRDHSGQLEFLGRTDSQVSVAGHRVELGEVESVLRSCPSVRAAAVGTHRNGQATTLMAYVVLDPGTTIDGVQARLGYMLPRHMIPGIMAVPRIPMGPTGKADFTNFQARPHEEPPGVVIPVPAVNPCITDVVRRVWREMLGIARVEPNDDFFSLGGDSVKATRVIVAVRERLVPDIPIRALFDHPTFQDFCAAVQAHRQSTASTEGQPL